MIVGVRTRPVLCVARATTAGPRLLQFGESWRQASRNLLFCNEHDNHLFPKVHTTPIAGS